MPILIRFLRTYYKRFGRYSTSWARYRPSVATGRTAASPTRWACKARPIQKLLHLSFPFRSLGISQ